MSQELVLAYDLGGTKVAAGIVDSRGKVCREIRASVPIHEGKESVVRQLIDVGRKLLAEFPKARRVGIGSAGPLDIRSGCLLDATNYVTDGKGWGKVPLARLLARGLKRPVVLENDAAAAMLAEHWMGVAKKAKNAMVLTLGTGVGVGVICDGKLIRSGRMLHPESSHLIIREGDPEAPCGCGNHGCIEAYLSGKNFTQRMRKRWGEPDLRSETIVERARAGEKRACEAFEEYARLLAVSLQNFAVLYAPEVVAFTGGFAAASDLFLPSARQHLERLLVRRRIGEDLLPKLRVSPLENRAGIIGAAHSAFHRLK